jgi:hypothetical protein
MEEVHTEAGDVGSVAQSIDNAIVVGPLATVIGQEFARGHAVGLDWHGLVKILGVGQNARWGHEPAGEGPVEIHDVENMVFDVVGIDGNGPLDLFDGPPVNIERAVQDDTSVENFAQGLGEVPQLVAVLRLKVAHLVEGSDASQTGLDVARVGGPLGSGQWQGSHRFHSGNIERSQ